MSQPGAARTRSSTVCTRQTRWSGRWTERSRPGRAPSQQAGRPGRDSRVQEHLGQIGRLAYTGRGLASERLAPARPQSQLRSCSRCHRACRIRARCVRMSTQGPVRSDDLARDRHGLPLNRAPVWRSRRAASQIAPVVLTRRLGPTARPRGRSRHPVRCTARGRARKLDRLGCRSPACISRHAQAPSGGQAPAGRARGHPAGPASSSSPLSR